jgi:hypothetical protein
MVVQPGTERSQTATAVLGSLATAATEMCTQNGITKILLNLYGPFINILTKKKYTHTAAEWP